MLIPDHHQSISISYTLCFNLHSVSFSVIPVYVGFTLAALYRLFELRAIERAQRAEENGDLENGRKPVKFILGDEFDDSWIS